MDGGPRMEVLGEALALVFNPVTLLTILGAGAFGLLVGAIPGLTASMATALLIPLTFFMDPVPAIAAMVTVTAMAIFAGDIPGALLRIPGTPASAAYVEESYAITRRGRPELALGAALLCSAFGGLLGAIVLIVAAPTLAELAFAFSSFEYFWLACLGLTCTVLVSPGPALKGVVSLLLGLFIATVGLDPLTGQMRFTFGMPELSGGFGIVPVLIGLFAVGEVLRFAVRPVEIQPPPRTPMRHILRGLMPELWKYRMAILRGSGIGSGIGVLPGIGADISPYVSYALARRFSRTPEKFGTGHVEGIASATAANNASLSSAYVPTLVFGIPGDSLTAMIIGVLYMKGLNPGPTAFVQQPAAIYGIFIVFIVANLLMVPLGLATMSVLRRVLDVPRRILMPIILLFCLVGSFAVENTVTAVYVTIAFGVLGFTLESFRYPLAPVILGIVLGPLVEDRFITSMQLSHGDPLGFFERPIAAVLGVITLGLWAYMLYGMIRDVVRRRRNEGALGQGASS